METMETQGSTRNSHWFDVSNHQHFLVATIGIFLSNYYEISVDHINHSETAQQTVSY